jgi:hypothetical protein
MIVMQERRHSIGVRTGEPSVGDEAGREGVNGRDCPPDGFRLGDVDGGERRFCAVDELVDDCARSVDRGLTRERGNREVEASAHASAQGAKCDEIGRLFGLCELVAWNADQPVPTIASGEQRAVEAALGAATERRGPDDVELGNGRRSERG